MGTTPADEAALQGWSDFRQNFKVGDTDPYNGQKVTSEERSAAWRGKVLFSAVVADKKHQIYSFVFSNYSVSSPKIRPVEVRVNNQ